MINDPSIGQACFIPQQETSLHVDWEALVQAGSAFGEALCKIVQGVVAAFQEAMVPFVRLVKNVAEAFGVVPSPPRYSRQTRAFLKVLRRRSHQRAMASHHRRIISTKRAAWARLHGYRVVARGDAVL